MKWWGSLAVAVAIAVALVIFFTGEPERSFLELKNESLEKIFVEVSAGGIRIGGAQLEPGGRRFFSTGSAGDWEIACVEETSHRRGSFRPANAGPGPYLSVTLEGCARMTRTGPPPPS